MIRVYIACRFEDQHTARMLREALAEHDIICISRWLEEETESALGSGPEYRRERAEMDLRDIDISDALVLINPPEHHRTGTGGRHVETGHAIAIGHRVFIWGKRESIFHDLESVSEHATVDDLVEAINGALA